VKLSGVFRYVSKVSTALRNAVSRERRLVVAEPGERMGLWRGVFWTMVFQSWLGIRWWSLLLSLFGSVSVE